MSGEAQSAIVERLLKPYLKRWRLPSTIAPVGADGPVIPADRTEDDGAAA